MKHFYISTRTFSQLTFLFISSGHQSELIWRTQVCIGFRHQELWWEIHLKLRPDLDFCVCDAKKNLHPDVSYLSANIIVHHVNVCTRGQCHMYISRKQTKRKSDIPVADNG